MKQIVAMGGGGFSREPDNPLLDRYVLTLTNKPRPKVCFLPTASGDAEGYIVGFYQAMTQLGAEPSHLSLIRPTVKDLASFLLNHDVIYVGGGNTKNRGIPGTTLAADDGVALHYVGEELARVVSSRLPAKAYRVFTDGGTVREEALSPVFLG